MNKRVSNIIKYTLSLAVAVVLLYFSFKGVKWSDFVKGLDNCRWEFILVSMVGGVVAFYLRGLRWRELLLPVDPSTKRSTTFNAINIGYLANFVFPRIGEFVRCGFVTKNSASDTTSPVSTEVDSVTNSGSTNLAGSGKKLASYDKVLGTVVLERSWDVVVLFLLLLVLLVFEWQRFGEFFSEKMLKPLSSRLNFSLWWIVAAFIMALALLVWIVIKLRHRSKICGKICAFFAGIGQGVVSCLHMKHAWRFFLYTALIWVMYWLMSASIAWAVPEMSYLGPMDALFLMVAGSLGWLIPVPGGFGAFHYIVALALSTIYGVPFSLGIIFATLSHESQAITMIVCGGASYVQETLKKS